MGSNKAVHLMFLSGGLLLFFLLKWTSDWVAGYFVRTPNEILINGIAAFLAITIGIVLYRNDRLYELASEVMTELSKVTWPNRQETQMATLVVIITTLISAAILGLFDMVWSSITKLIYG